MTGKSPCTSAKHSEYSCLMKWGVSGKKFPPDKWCDGCRKYYADTKLIQEFESDTDAEAKKKKKSK